MINNYLNIALRNIKRRYTSSFVSVFGLSVGIAGALMTFLLVAYLFSFNRFYSKADRTYWIVTDMIDNQHMQMDVVPRPMAEVLRNEVSSVETAVRLNNVYGGIVTVNDKSGRNVKKFEESRNICFTEREFFQIFDTKWAYGNVENVLSKPNTVVLSRAYALKYFGVENAIGRNFRFDNKAEFEVTGIIENPPSNTQLRYDVMMSYASLPALNGNAVLADSWSEPSTMCWVALKDGSSISALNASFEHISKKYIAPETAKKYHFTTIPLSEMFHTPGYGPAPRPLLYALVIVGIFLVLAACVNFINLSTAQSIMRAREVGVRKALGSSRLQLTYQFMIETSVLCLIAFSIGIVMTQMSLPALNNALSMLHADISVLNLLSPNTLSWLLILILGVIIASGLYPALAMARFAPVKALKGVMNTPARGKVSVRKTLVGVQFFITQLFIIGLIVMWAQIKYMKTTDLGFNRDAILMVKLPSTNSSKQETLRNHFKEIVGIEALAFCGMPPMTTMQTSEPFRFDNRTEAEKFQVTVRAGDMDYAQLFGLQIIAGRNFQSNDTTRHELLVNEKLAKQLGFSSGAEILGKNINLWGQNRMVVGVVKDFHLEGMRALIQPAAIVNMPSIFTMAAIKINPKQTTSALRDIETAWSGHFTDQVYNASFLDERLNEFYVTEHILLALIKIFSGIAVFIGCLGIYGLIMFLSETKAREIGVRKVLGANVKQLLWILGKEFALLLVIGFLLAAPLGGFLMENWLRGYAYKVNISWWIFALTLGIVCIITLLTISFQSLRAISANPIKSLRND